MGQVTAAAVYARISSDQDGTALGVKRQVEDCRKLAGELGWTVAEEYVDNDISAHSGKKRPAYEAMLQDLAEGRRDAVLVYHADRLTRRPIELEQFFEARLRHRLVRRHRRQHPQHPHGGYQRPFGFADDKIAHDRAEAEVVRTMVARMLAGESARSITTWLNDSDVAPVSGKTWSTTTVRAIVTSPRIAGLREHRGEVVGEAVWDPIISVEDHHRAIAQVESRKVTKKRAPQRYLLSGLLAAASARTGSTHRNVQRHDATCAHPGRITAAAAD